MHVTTSLLFNGFAEEALAFYKETLDTETLFIAKQIFAALANGGKVTMPPTFFAAQFGIVTDPFGVTWKIIADAPSTV